MRKKLLSALLVFAMVLSFVPSTAFASAGGGEAQPAPVLKTGIAADQAALNTALNVAAGTSDSNKITVTDAGDTTNLLWFVMTGLTGGTEYTLSMKNSSNNELLNANSVDLSKNDENNPAKFTEPSGSTGYYLYLSFDIKAQYNEDNLAAGNYTVTLSDNSSTTLVTKTVTLAKNGEEATGTWTLTEQPENVEITAEVTKVSASGADAVTINEKTVSGKVDPAVYAVTDNTAKADFVNELDESGKVKGDNKFVLANIKFANLDGSKNYKVKQTNNALTLVYPDEFSDGVKEKVYAASVLSSDGLNFMLCDSATDANKAVKFEVFEESGTNALIAFEITNNVTFETEAGVTVTNATAIVVNADNYATDLPQSYVEQYPLDQHPEANETFPWLVVKYARNNAKAVTFSITKDGAVVSFTEGKTSPETKNADAYQMWQIKSELGQDSVYGTYAVTLSVAGESDVTANAVYTDPNAEKATVTFAAGEGSGDMEATTVNKGGTYKLPTCTFSAPQGKEFAGWLVGADTNPKAAGTEITVTEDVTVTATWKVSIPAISLTFTTATLSEEDKTALGLSSLDLGEFTIGTPDENGKAVVAGTAKYVAATKFHGTVEAENKGHYLPLMINGLQTGDTLTVTNRSDGSKNGKVTEITDTNKEYATLVWLDGVKGEYTGSAAAGLADKSFTVKVEREGATAKTYIIDFSSLEMLEGTKAAANADATVTSDPDTGKATATVTDSAITDAIEKAKQDQASESGVQKDEVIVTDLTINAATSGSGTPAKATDVTLDAKVLTAIKAETKPGEMTVPAIETATIVTDVADVTLPLDQIDEIDKASAGASIEKDGLKLVVEDTKDAAAAPGPAQTVAAAIDVTLQTGTGDELTVANIGKPIKLVVRFEADDEKVYTVTRDGTKLNELADDKNTAGAEGWYLDKTTKTLTLWTKHLSTFILLEQAASPAIPTTGYDVAPLHDTRTGADAIADNDLYTAGSYKLGTVEKDSDGIVVIPVQVTGLKQHQNGDTPASMGCWVGVKFPAIAGWTMTAYKRDNQTSAADLTGDLEADGSLKAYYRTEDGKGNRPVWITYTKAGSNPAVTCEIKYIVNLSGVKEYVAPGAYTVTVTPASNGTVSVDKLSAAAGDTVTITATPSKGYEVGTITVEDEDNGKVTLTGLTFTMPAKNVTVTVTFKAAGSEKGLTVVPTKGNALMNLELTVNGFTGSRATIQVRTGATTANNVLYYTDVKSGSVEVYLAVPTDTDSPLVFTAWDGEVTDTKSSNDLPHTAIIAVKDMWAEANQ